MKLVYKCGHVARDVQLFGSRTAVARLRDTLQGELCRTCAAKHSAGDVDVEQAVSDAAQLIEGCDDYT